MSIDSQEFETKKEIVNKAIRICIQCGSKSVLIDDSRIYCKDCNSNFIIKGKT